MEEWNRPIFGFLPRLAFEEAKTPAAALPREEGQVNHCLLPFEGGKALLLCQREGEKRVMARFGLLEGREYAFRRPFPVDLGANFSNPRLALLPGGEALLCGELAGEGPARGFPALPRAIGLRRDGSLFLRQVAEMGRLRGKRLFMKRDFSLHEGENPLKGIEGRHLGAVIRFEAGVSALNFELLRGENGQKATLRFDGAAEEMSLDCSMAGGLGPQGGAVLGQGINELRLYLDGPAIEVFFNGSDCLSALVFPGDAEGAGLRLFAEGGLRVHQAELFEIEQSAF
ncbi:MAG: GH32 C-terminal domain-containing protein [Christensenellaceae bacterium]|nr:GH32 C-terminal domain-containing protein [Christensenellaceae bacterium]